MTGRTDTPRMAEWMREAKDLVGNPHEVGKHLTVGMVSNKTGLATRTIEDTLTRKRITNEGNPRSALCRPEYRFGKTPLWSHEQVERYKKLAAQTKHHDDTLPLVTVAEAYERSLVSTAEIRERLGLHDQTLRRYQRDDNDYPEAVARLSREGSPGVPEHLREWVKVLGWALRHDEIEVPPKWLAKAEA